MIEKAYAIFIGILLVITFADIIISTYKTKKKDDSN